MGIVARWRGAKPDVEVFVFDELGREEAEMMRLAFVIVLATLVANAEVFFKAEGDIRLRNRQSRELKFPGASSGASPVTSSSRPTSARTTL